MKNLITAAALGAALLAGAPAMAQTNVSISVGQPGFYGRLDIGDFGPPPVVYAQPVIVQRQRYVSQPIYLRVPPGHQKHWNKHCAQYNACGQRVLFVRDDWYNNTYAPRYIQQHPRMERREVRYENPRPEHGREYYVQEERGNGKHKDKDRDDDGDRGHGNGNGHGNGHGNGKH